MKNASKICSPPHSHRYSWNKTDDQSHVTGLHCLRLFVWCPELTLRDVERNSHTKLATAFTAGTIQLNINWYEDITGDTLVGDTIHLLCQRDSSFEGCTKELLLSTPEAMKSCASHGKRKNRKETSNTLNNLLSFCKQCKSYKGL